MEINQDHSKLKLAIAVVTSPSAAFEEILRRNLLTSGLWIAFVAGCLTTAAALIHAIPLGPVHFLALGYANPVTWIGLLLLYSIALHALLKWLGTDTDYRDILTIMCWAQVTLVAAQALVVVETALTVAAGTGLSAAPVLDLAANALRFGYVLVIGAGVRTVSGVTLARGALGYLLIHLAATIAFTVSYARSRLTLFTGAPMGISYAAQAVVLDQTPPWVNDSTPWLAAGMAGYALALWFLGRSLGWDESVRKRRVITAAVIGIAVFGGYYYTLTSVDYYGRLLSAQRLYERERYAEAAKKIEKLLPDMPGESLWLMLDIGDMSYLAGDDRKAAAYYGKVLASPRVKLAAEQKLLDACAHVGLGAVYDIDGKYPKAIIEFEKAEKLWPAFREPWSRLAVTYARMGNYDKAIEVGNHAVEKMKSEAPEAYLAQAQAYAIKGKIDEARDAYKKLTELDKDLAGRIGKTPADWKNAVGKLTRRDLKFPLEKELAQPSEKPNPKPRAKQKRG